MSDGLYNHEDRKEGIDRRNGPTPSTLINRNVTVDGHRTSIRLEAVMWHALHDIGARERLSVNALVTLIAQTRRESSLTAAIRVRLMTYYQEAATEDGHIGAGHGRANSFGARAIANQRGSLTA